MGALLSSYSIVGKKKKKKKIFKDEPKPLMLSHLEKGRDTKFFRSSRAKGESTFFEIFLVSPLIDYKEDDIHRFKKKKTVTK